MKVFICLLFILLSYQVHAQSDFDKSTLLNTLNDYLVKEKRAHYDDHSVFIFTFSLKENKLLNAMLLEVNDDADSIFLK